MVSLNDLLTHRQSGPGSGRWIRLLASREQLEDVLEFGGIDSDTGVCNRDDVGSLGSRGINRDLRRLGSRIADSIGDEVLKQSNELVFDAVYVR